MINRSVSSVGIRLFISDRVNDHFDALHEVAQRFALLALGQVWTLLGSRKNSKPEKCL
jgi:hypothetical protein